MDIIARVVECHGRRAVVALPDGSRHAAEVFGKRLRIVCGDEVKVQQPDAHNASHAWQIREVLPRRSQFVRTDSRGQSEVLAANLTQLVVLMTEQPASDPYIVDRYLAGAEFGNLPALLVITKTELGLSTEMHAHVDDYVRAGYRVIKVSAFERHGLDELRAALMQQRSMLVGESGVGKSTLTNALLGTEAQATRTLSDSTGEGRHTTVSSAMFDLPDIPDSKLMDSPGVRDYAPAPISDLQVAFGWRELVALQGQCKFNNCLHLREPGCAARAAVDAGQMSSRRYESYKRLLNLMRQLAAPHERR